LDIVEGQSAAAQQGATVSDEEEEESFLSEQFRNALIGVDEILGGENLSE
jgi:hypothetical protein